MAKGKSTNWSATVKRLWSNARIAIWCLSIAAMAAVVALFATTGAVDTAIPPDCLHGLEKVQVPKPCRRIAYTGFTDYFNPEWHMPSCVVYELTRNETQGTVSRYDNFETESAVDGCAKPGDYAGSGYDRGHIAPAADFKWSSKAMRETFKMTNVCPQAQSLNSGGWSRLEEKVREWAVRDSAIVVASGPVVKPGHRTAGAGKVAVPQAFFKVVLAPYATPPRAIAFIYPNGPAGLRLKDYAVTVDSVEAATGLDFFSALPDRLENTIERQCNINQWVK